MARVAVIGLGKVGVPLASYLTTLSHQVVGVDVDAGLVERLRQGKNPLPWEPAMNLQAFEATLSLSEALEGAECAIVIVPTPQRGDRLSGDHVRLAIEKIRDVNPSVLVLVASTLDPEDIHAICRGLGSNIVYNPVMIRLGYVVEDLAQARFLLIGGGTRSSGTGSSAYGGPGGRPPPTRSFARIR